MAVYHVWKTLNQNLLLGEVFISWGENLKLSPFPSVIVYKTLPSSAKSTLHIYKFHRKEPPSLPASQLFPLLIKIHHKITPWKLELILAVCQSWVWWPNFGIRTCLHCPVWQQVPETGRTANVGLAMNENMNTMHAVVYCNLCRPTHKVLSQPSSKPSFYKFKP